MLYDVFRVKLKPNNRTEKGDNFRFYNVVHNHENLGLIPKTTMSTVFSKDLDLSVSIRDPPASFDLSFDYFLLYHELISVFINLFD